MTVVQTTLELTLRQQGATPQCVAKVAAQSQRARATPRGEASREAFLDHAIDLIGEGGYGALTVSAICKRAGTSPTSLYWHFGDKAGLMTEMVKHSLRQDSKDFLKDIRSLLPTLPLVDAYVTAFRRLVVRERPTSWSVITALSEGRHHAPEITTLVNHARKLQIDFAESWVRTLSEAPEPRMTAHVIVSFNVFVADHYRRTRSEAEIDEMLNTMRSAMLAMGSPCLLKRIPLEAFDHAVSTAIATTEPLGGR